MNTQCPHCGLEDAPTQVAVGIGSTLAVVAMHRRADWIEGTDSDVEMCMGAGLPVGQPCKHALSVSRRHCWSFTGDTGRTEQARPVPRTIKATS